MSKTSCLMVHRKIVYQTLHQWVQKQLKSHHSSKDKIKRSIHKKTEIRRGLIHWEMVSNALKTTKLSKALGPDDIAPIMLIPFMRWGQCRDGQETFERKHQSVSFVGGYLQDDLFYKQGKSTESPKCLLTYNHLPSKLTVQSRQRQTSHIISFFIL